MNTMYLLIKNLKKDYVEAMTLDLSNNYWNTVNTVLTKDMNLVDYGINLKKCLMKLFQTLILIIF